jgi:hypothetical protein
MKRLLFAALLALYGNTSSALAWSNHALASYRAFEGMPEVAQAAAGHRPNRSKRFWPRRPSPSRQFLARQDAWAQAQHCALPAPACSAAL